MEVNEVIENIKKYGGKNSRYKPFKNAIFYPLHTQDFVRTGFMEICPTLSAMGTGGGQVPMIIDNARVLGGLGEKKSNKGTQFFQQDRVYSSDGCAVCHPSQLTGGSYKYLVNDYDNYRIRKLTPKECWRLMGFTDDEFEKAAAVNSNTQLYKQAGNSIVVDVLVAIFGEMIKSLEGKTEYKYMEQMSLFDYM